MSNEMNDNQGLGIDLQETCISRKPIKKSAKKYRSKRLNFVLLLREGDTQKILYYLDPPEIREAIQIEIDSMRNNAFGNVEKYYQKLKNRWAEYGY